MTAWASWFQSLGAILIPVDIRIIFPLCVTLKNRKSSSLSVPFKKYENFALAINLRGVDFCVKFIKYSKDLLKYLNKKEPLKGSLTQIVQFCAI